MTQFSTLVTVRAGKLKLLDREGFNRGLSEFMDGEEIELTLQPVDARKTRQQEKGFHAMIQPWAREEGHAIEDLKRDLMAEIFGVREHTDVVSGVTVMVLCEPRTSQLNKKQYNELIERTLDIAASCGHLLVAPSEYRERHAKKRSAA
jgi:hypothetical protein